ncbi:DivIVA domain [Arthrobacter agilis]|uniref:DivIVA domain-containing protein n=1 Tax=Arthrobacter agilis TaxID=37921 RepID=UPI000F6F847F|nr:DivIVA domain-containing protein [Arthrobacter agilis]VDR32808.1 DivIVA domain [Arthrobacter agilis]
MTIFLVILAILVMGGTAVLVSERGAPLPGRRGAGESVREAGRLRGDGLGLVEPVASLPPVLLPEKPTARDVDAVRFGLGLRGYRMDQVDEVLDRLAAALAEKDAVIAGLRAESAVPGSR